MLVEFVLYTVTVTVIIMVLAYGRWNFSENWYFLKSLVSQNVVILKLTYIDCRIAIKNHNNYYIMEMVSLKLH